ncbi:glutathione S-transferase family protein [Simkania sp.]|uniref:glutathione S-transferase family protein n=1 Tax=Simkania sp. TaxID=34094 RepID=UPI003B518211
MSLKKDIHLYTATAVNGWKPVIFLEEANIEYDLTVIDFSKMEQKSKDYMALNPNGRIPTIVDRSNNDFVVFESGAILWYIAEKYGKFLPAETNEKSRTLQWLMFQMSGIGPMMGQAMYFQHIAPKNGGNNPFAIKRYVDESRRLFEVLNTHLEGRTYLVNNEFTIADIATYPWARAYSKANIPIDGLEYLQAWFERMDAREATQRAMDIPTSYWEYLRKGQNKPQD